MENLSLHTVLQYSVTALEGMAVLLAFISYPKYSHTYLRFFPWLLLYVLLTEVFAIPIYEAFETNVVLYNVYNVVFFMYFYFIFYKKEENKRNRVWIKTVAGIFILASIINLSFRSFIFQPQLLAYIVGACALILCIILYFIDILYTPQILNIRKDLLFWVSTGLLLFYVGYIPIKVTRHFFEEPGHEFGTLMIVHRILILVMNICFIIGFLWTRKK